MNQPYRIPAPPPRIDQLVTSDGEPMESWRHVRQMLLLIDSLSHAWRDRDDVFVGGNMFLYFSETQARNNDFRGPDFFAVTNTVRRERLAWVVWEEDGRVPDLVIELLSESTEHVDRGDKMRIYASLGVAEYFLFDPFTGVLEGYELEVRGEYRRKSCDEHGRFRSERVGFSLGTQLSTIDAVEADWLRWFDDEGRVLPRTAELAEAEHERAEAAAERADAERERADVAVQHAQIERGRANVEQARAEAAARHAQIERGRANVEQARADAERERADAERERADRLAAELEALKRR
jgi:Uma2 family endonuclease